MKTGGKQRAVGCPQHPQLTVAKPLRKMPLVPRPVSGQGEHVLAEALRVRPADRKNAGPKRRPGSARLVSPLLADKEALLPELAVRHRPLPPSTV